MRTAVRPDARPEDLRQPGHIFPLMAQPGGVLTRAGHTEAGCDLARLAGCESAAVIVEILNEDGTMARRPDLEKFAAAHDLKIGSIADLIRYRLDKERSVERVADQVVQTEFGPFRMCWYEDHVHRTVHVALVRGDITGPVPPLVRVHLKDTLRDVIGVRTETVGWTLHGVMRRIADEDNGIVIVLRQHESARDIMAAVASLDAGHEPPAHPQEGGTVLRTYGIGAQILKDLGVRRMRVLSSPKQMLGISAFGLEVSGYVD